MDGYVFSYIRYFPFIYILGTFTLMALGIYFMVTAIGFMKEKKRRDQELLEKLDRLNQLLSDKER